CLQYNSAPYTF
nr:immunoglobulin light chain junction region [Macaca mulatta]MOW39764.1 immunoglobulin light chain junction region [Macaca mulatta]MOW40563.1 immunoglobulin light chain junction region [Macaca mulatta]